MHRAWYLAFQAPANACLIKQPAAGLTAKYGTPQQPGLKGKADFMLNAKGMGIYKCRMMNGIVLKRSYKQVVYSSFIIRKSYLTITISPTFAPK